MTIHKSQGQTYDKVIIDLNKFGKFRNRALFYVAFSRVKQLSNLYLIGKFNSMLRTKSDDILQNEITNLKTNKKLSLSFIKNIPESEIIIIYHNVRSLTKNIKYIINDTWYHQADIIIFSETYTINSDAFNIDQFKIIYRSDCNNQRKKGIICFAEKKIIYNIIKHETYNCYQNDKLQHIDLVLIQINNNLILTGYKSPSVDKNTFETNIDKFDISKFINNNIIFIGDFNYNVNLENSYLEKFLRNKNLSSALPNNISTTNFDT